MEQNKKEAIAATMAEEEIKFDAKACPKCLKTKENSDNFCGDCGTKLVLAEVSLK